MDSGLFDIIMEREKGCSVTQRIKEVKQPRGGYINPKEFRTISLGDGIDNLNQNETTNAGLVGMAVDYLTRFMLGSSVETAFCISMFGAILIGEEKKAKRLMTGVKGLDKRSIINAVKLCGFDVCFRAGIMGYKPVDEIMPDDAAIENINTMVNRSLLFFHQYGPSVLVGFTFEGGYTNIIGSGDGDFTTKDTLWDFKVSKKPVSKEQTLQLLIYWRMGLHSTHLEFKTIQYLGIYNPRKNIVSQIAVANIPRNIICEVETDVIGYPD